MPLEQLGSVAGPISHAPCLKAPCMARQIVISYLHNRGRIVGSPIDRKNNLEGCPVHALISLGLGGVVRTTWFDRRLHLPCAVSEGQYMTRQIVISYLHPRGRIVGNPIDRKNTLGGCPVHVLISLGLGSAVRTTWFGRRPHLACAVSEGPMYGSTDRHIVLAYSRTNRREPHRQEKQSWRVPRPCSDLLGPLAVPSEQLGSVAGPISHAPRLKATLWIDRSSYRTCIVADEA